MLPNGYRTVATPPRPLAGERVGGVYCCGVHCGAGVHWSTTVEYTAVLKHHCGLHCAAGVHWSTTVECTVVPEHQC